VTARTSRKPRTPKPPGRVRRYLRRQIRPALPYAAWLALFALAALVLQSWLPLVFALGGITALAGDRLRLHLGWHRRGGKAAMRKRARYQGQASLGEISRNFGLGGQGVPIGTVRRGS
jgi:hypothetical protein